MRLGIMFAMGVALLLLTVNISVTTSTPTTPPVSNRPPPALRKFNSTVIEEVIAEVTARIADPVIATMFEQNFPNTLDTTVDYFGIDKKTGRFDTFVITGDIEAMWQRDSTNQVLPYLPYMLKEKKLENMVIGLINRQIKNVVLDPYANAYNFNATGSPFDSDSTTKLDRHGNRVSGMIPGIWERKFEIDSLAAVLKLQVLYHEHTQNSKAFMHADYFKSLEVIHTLLTEQQLGTVQEDKINRVPYTFQRNAWNPTDTTSHSRGNLCTGQDGMVKSFFRPSDDACTFGYFVPGNAMLVTYLNKTAHMIAMKEPFLSKKLRNLSERIKQDIYARGLSKDKDGNAVFAYEVDGFGNKLKMDDANIPSLLSLPYLEFIDKTDPLYIATRNMILDPEQNPYYFTGKAGQGIGGPHAGAQNIWPMAIITRAMTSDDDEEIIYCLKTLKATTDGTLFIHESFYSEDPKYFTRPWFAWANTYFGELILRLLKDKPYLLEDPQYLGKQQSPS